ncbi:hypothetical protein VMCG_08152 [Cytospora schulzeri]|uniref:Uncharacterized protein n=1 Tax=Cytospora schulzeri TaxID=448051 RepID=A0A423VU48_9PEZI|nr:hypothetical protein VMCG_08152 [Valsa malicola]
MADMTRPELSKTPDAAAVTSAEDLYTMLETTSPDLVNDFDQKYDTWKKTWDNDNINTGPEYNTLIALGPKIIPLIVYRLTSGNDYMAVDLCMNIYYRLTLLADNELENIFYKVEVKEPRDKSNYQLATNAIIRKVAWRSLEVKDALNAWAEFRLQRQNYASAGHFCEGDAYWTLTEIGPGIIAPMMLEYYNDRYGWWHELLHELLHELVHGKTSGAAVFFKPVLFAEWKDWFEHKDHKDAPEGPDARVRAGHGYCMCEWHYTP